MTIVAFALRDQLESNAVDEKELMFKYNQGDGMKSRSDKYSWINYLVCSKDIISGDIQLYEYITPLFQHPEFFNAAGRTNNPCVYGPVYQTFLRMVHGDSK